MEGSVLSFLKAEWKVSDTGSVLFFTQFWCVFYFEVIILRAIGSMSIDFLESTICCTWGEHTNHNTTDTTVSEYEYINLGLIECKLCMNNHVSDTGSGEPLVYYEDVHLPK
jgi:hypothetical protein